MNYEVKFYKDALKTIQKLDTTTLETPTTKVASLTPDGVTGGILE